MAKDFAYTHYCGYRPVNPNWNKNLECKLVTSLKS